MRYIKSHEAAASVMTILLVMFVLRVLGQLLVLLFEPAFLPPFDFWQADLIPYWLLLTGQIVIIYVYHKMIHDVGNQSGYFSKTRKGFTHELFYFNIFYALVMVTRFFILGLSIPVVFHWILAAFLFAFIFHHKELEKTKHS
jgi:hypothetical protein